MSTALDREDKWKVKGSSQSGSSPAANSPSNASGEVSTAKCQRAPNGAEGKPKSTASLPALNIRKIAHCNRQFMHIDPAALEFLYRLVRFAVGSIYCDD
jgi:hypothetical protein